MCRLSETMNWPRGNTDARAHLSISEYDQSVHEEAEGQEKQGAGLGGRRGHLSTVKGLVGGVIVVEEAHVDEVDKQAGGILGGEGVIGRPLVEDQQDEVAKQAGHEHDLWDEAQEDVQGLLEVPGGYKNR